ncbi:MAG: alpha-mannosidase [Planctomycetota bacterium]|jgi:alpha-mannosidase
MAHTAAPLNQLVYQRVKSLTHRIQGMLWESQSDLKVLIGPTHQEAVKLSAAKRDRYSVIEKGKIFAPATQGPHGEFPWGQRWFKIKVPKATPAEKGRRYLEWVAHGETNVYMDGKPWAGLDCCHPTCPLPDKATTLWLDCGLWQTGIWGPVAPPDHHGFRFESAKLSVRNLEAWEIYHDVAVLFEWLGQQFQEEGITPTEGFGFVKAIETVKPLFRRMLRRLNEACDAYDSKGLTAFGRAIKRIYKDFPAEALSMTASYVGHAHIDLVWLWPEHATYKKGIHTFATQLRLMEKYPEMTFTMSQPPLYYHIAENEPAQKREIDKRIREGRWEFTGGLEVEADTQIPVGEGLARSLIYGQERIKAARGTISDTVWIPDVFGYSQCLPQLFSLGGIKNFYTTKILWSAITQFPHNSFTWKSPDGSSVLTHLAVAGYNCEIRPREVAAAEKEYRQSDVHNELLCAAGYGDGGGGPTEEHCERAKRLTSLAGLPKSGWTTVEEFFGRLAEAQEALPTYRGELYLEYHRGVQTTQSDLKKYLRACERALQTREAVRAIGGGEALAPEEWLRYLFAHFHDAIPGSSIRTVYEELNPELAAIAEKNLELAAKEWGATRSARVAVVNPLAVPRTNLVELEAPKGSVHLTDAEGTVIPTQMVGRGKARKALAVLSQAGLESTELTWQEGRKVVENPLVATPSRLCNGIVDARFNASGELSALKVDGEPMLIERAASFMIHNDTPAEFDAWDIDHAATWTLEKVCRKMMLEVVEIGPVRAILRGSCSVGERSAMEVDFILEAGARELKVEARVDWREDHKLLRYQVPTGYRGEAARFGAPFGSVDRSQTEGLPQDEAQWEVPASRWASVVDGRGEGLALVTEAKYGFSARDGLIGLSLLRSPKHPDPQADMGEHTIRFAIGKHSDVSAGEVLSTAARADTLFTPALVVSGGSAKPAPFELGQLGSVVPSWVMPARSAKGTVIRLHETAGASQEVEIRFTKAPKSVESVDLFEAKLPDGAKVTRKSPTRYIVAVAPYKIVTLKIR